MYYFTVASSHPAEVKMRSRPRKRVYNRRSEHRDTTLINRLRCAEKSLNLLRKQIQTKAYQHAVTKSYLRRNGISKNQIKKLLHPERKHIRGYTKDEIITAVIIRHMSPRAYTYLRGNSILPLPSKASIESYLNKFIVKPGVQTEFLNMISANLKHGDLHEKQCIIVLDEMEVKKKYEYDRRSKQVFKPHKKVQVVLVRGLLKSWKQVIYLGFDTNMTKALLTELILLCENQGAVVRAVGFDMGNHGLIKELGVLKNENFKFTHPTDSSRVIYTICDVPHLVKLFRNHCLDEGFIFNYGTEEEFTLGKEDFQLLLRNDGADLKLCPKLSSIHINVHGSARQRVRLATQIFSKTVSKAMEFQFGELYQPQCKVVSTVDNWFDTLNSRVKFTTKPLSCGYGVNLEEQEEALDEMDLLIQNMRFANNPESRTKKPFQKGILVSNKAIRALFQDLKGDLENFEYLLTARCNQDVLENFFSRLRGNFYFILCYKM